ncbi:MAG TPA: ribosome maturation factor RimM [Gemmatimonadota bacterium]|nr:ribosome maturation factor RimM [Gemmatimonadota bacterium]
MAGAPEHLAVGRIVSPHGLRGEALVFLLSEEESRFAEGARLHLSPTPEGEGGMVEVTIEASRPHKGKRILKLDRFADRTMVERRVGWYLVVPYEAAEAERADDEFFLHALMGRDVRTADGRLLGQVTDILDSDGPPLLEFGQVGGGRRLLPFVKEFVAEVTDQAVVVTPPDGWEEI